MRIANNTVVRFEYTLKGDDGELIESSEGDEPLSYLHGHEQIVPGLERAMADRAAGDAFEVEVAPEDGYGVHEDDAVFTVPRDKLPDGLEPEIGMELGARGPDGQPFRFRIVGVRDDEVTCDANHALADKTLHFSVKVIEVRAATEDEIAHGHAHGEGCVH